MRKLVVEMVEWFTDGNTEVKIGAEDFVHREDTAHDSGVGEYDGAVVFTALMDQECEMFQAVFAGIQHIATI